MPKGYPNPKPEQTTLDDVLAVVEQQNAKIDQLLDIVCVLASPDHGPATSQIGAVMHTNATWARDVSNKIKVHILWRDNQLRNGIPAEREFETGESGMRLMERVTETEPEPVE